ncbi:MAG TPA: TonB family protein [Longimicrobiales bacterium]|nr:TonB family protein [Longimicrobiales bacterium]
MLHVDDGQLHALLDGELDAEDPEGADAVELHLAACAECRARLEAQEELHDRIHGLLGRSGPRRLVVPPFEELAGKAAAEASRSSRWALLADPDRLHTAAWIASFVIILAGTASLVVGLVLGRFAAEEDRGGRTAPAAGSARSAQAPAVPAPRTRSVPAAESSPRAGSAPGVTRAPRTASAPPEALAPRPRDPAELERAVRRLYPPRLREAGIGGTVVVRALVDGTGRVLASRVAKSSGHAALDAAALKVLEATTFTPAPGPDRRAPAWIELPVVFRTP